MEQNGLIRNISGTVCVIGLALSTINVNSTMVINGDYNIPYVGNSYFNENSSAPYSFVDSNIYFDRKSSNRLEEEANALFGSMRNATMEEQESVNKYIKSISKETGVNFFDIC